MMFYATAAYYGKREVKISFVLQYIIHVVDVQIVVHIEATYYSIFGTIMYNTISH